MPEPAFPYTLELVGVVMRPNLDDPHEQAGVLNPAAVVAPDGRILLYPRVVAHVNRSRIGVATVTLTDGVPTGVERQGILLEPERPWEHGANHGGVEDPRLTRVDALGLYLMTYVAFGPLGPRGGLLVSEDLASWRRVGPFQFAYDDELGIDLNLYPNKDLVWLPEPVTGPDGTPCLAFIHRPMWEVWPNLQPLPPDGIDEPRASIWISYVRLADAQADPAALLRPWGHRVLATPEYPWEVLKLGGGPPPIRVEEGWLLLHHGVSGTMSADPFEPQKEVFYAAGGMILDADDPSRVLQRTDEPLLAPLTDEERVGVVGNVVFPTAVVEVEGQHYVFYGMADEAIGVARLTRAAG